MEFVSGDIPTKIPRGGGGRWDLAEILAERLVGGAYTVGSKILDRILAPWDQGHLKTVFESRR